MALVNSRLHQCTAPDRLTSARPGQAVIIRAATNTGSFIGLNRHLSFNPAIRSMMNDSDSPSTD